MAKRTNERHSRKHTPIYMNNKIQGREKKRERKDVKAVPVTTIVSKSYVPDETLEQGRNAS
jgi:hypothetical protein